MDTNWSRTEVIVHELTYDWTISNFEYCLYPPGKAIYSPLFSSTENDQQWRIKLYPGGVSDLFKGYISVHLQYENYENTDAVAKFMVSILMNDDSCDNLAVSPVCRFSKKSLGFDKFVKLEKVMDESRHLLSKGELTLRCRIFSNVGISNSTSSRTEFPNNNSNLADDLEWIMATQAQSDVTLIVGGEIFKTHKLILSARSSRFLEMFDSLPMEREFEIKDISPKLMKAVLRYFYTGKIEIDCSMTKDFLLVSQNYEFMNDDLLNFCEAKLFKGINPANALDLLIFLESADIDRFKRNVIKYLSHHLKEVVLSDNFPDFVNTYPYLLRKICDVPD